MYTENSTLGADNDYQGGPMTAALLAALALLVGTGPARPSTSPRILLKPVDFHGVTLDDGPLKRQLDATLQFYLRIPNDDLLKGFRRRAGRPAPGAEMGGWYSDDVFHVFGQILSGLARLHAATGDPAPRAKLDALVHGWGECIEADGYFYASRKPNATHYTYEKMVGGLVDAMVYAHNSEAKGLLRRITDWAVPNLVRGRPYAGGGIDTEWYTLTENLDRAWLATGDPVYRDFARVWEYTDYWAIYSRGGDINRPRPDGMQTAAYHAYSHVNTLSGAAASYRVTGRPDCLKTLTGAYDYLQAHQAYATGGYGPDELLVAAADRRAHTLATHNTFETQCGSWAVFKLCKSLISFTGRARYGDWVEAMVINGIGASLPNADDGRVFYYADYNPYGATKSLNPTPWTCCSGTRPMAIADYCDQVYYLAPDGVCVNLYAASTLRWRSQGVPVLLRQRTRYPEQETVELAVMPARPVSFALRFRVPGWLGGAPIVMVNRSRAAARVDAQGWLVLSRTWRPGDSVFLRFPMRFRTVPLDHLSRYPIALMYGPVAMAFRSERAVNPGLLAGDPAKALVPSPGEALTWHLASRPATLVRPFYAVRELEPYFLYLDPASKTRIRGSAGRWEGTWHDSSQFRFTDTVGTAVEFDFVGTGLAWLGFRYDDAGVGQVMIDGKPVACVDQYGPGRDLAFDWRHDGLPYGKHTVRIVAQPDQVPGSKGHYINVAGIEVLGGREDEEGADRQGGPARR